MFGGNYFPKKFFAERYYPPVSGGGTPSNDIEASLSGHGSLSATLTAIATLASTINGIGRLTLNNSTPGTLRTRSLLRVGV